MVFSTPKELNCPYPVVASKHLLLSRFVMELATKKLCSRNYYWHVRIAICRWKLIRIFACVLVRVKFTLWPYCSSLPDGKSKQNWIAVILLLLTKHFFFLVGTLINESVPFTFIIYTRSTTVLCSFLLSFYFQRILSHFSVFECFATILLFHKILSQLCKLLSNVGLFLPFLSLVILCSGSLFGMKFCLKVEDQNNQLSVTSDIVDAVTNCVVNLSSGQAKCGGWCTPRQFTNCLSIIYF